jgi:hypothetical protein
MQRGLGVFIVLVGTLLSVVSLSAQSGQGSLNGYVKDEQGGVLPGVTVTATWAGDPHYPGHRCHRHPAGFYRLSHSRPARWTISAEFASFSAKAF